MGNHLTWFVVIMALAVVSSLTLTATAGVRLRDGRSAKPALVVGMVAGTAYVLVGLAWASERLAGLDARVVELLAGDRKEMAAAIFSVLTTAGDSIPMTLIAAGIAAALYQRTGAWQVWLLPVVVIVEQVLQVGTVTALPTLGMADVAPDVVDGFPGSYPSGSVARMVAVFGVAALLCERLHVSGAAALRTTGVVLVLEQAVSRLYLGRHLLVDIVGGWLLGLVLVAGAALVLQLVLPRRDPERDPARARPRRPRARGAS